MLTLSLSFLLSSFRKQNSLCLQGGTMAFKHMILSWWCVNSGFCYLSPIYWSLLAILLTVMFLIITMSPEPLSYPRYWYFSAFLPLIQHSSSSLMKGLTITLSHARNYQHYTYPSEGILIVNSQWIIHLQNTILRDWLFLLTSSVNSLILQKMESQEY